MPFKKSFIAVVLFFTMLGLSGATYAKEVRRDNAEILKEVDAKIQAALDAVPAGNSDELATRIKEASETASDLSANYKFEFERDKAVIKLKKARQLTKASDFSGAEQELKNARESFAALPKFQ
ncbi:MAG: hypothetical protein M0R33_16665 [Methylomonas sp.]|jgi:N-acetyl-gamma-glutamylphosphate reductase|uniref:hypothetical protein n=1 Tax=Methylomonas sp. TaxID=418 RepID=UPI0025F823AA|nr:hypothetical protein [Methylomonas sp.]MCK9608077.1 hypothetical protein [Methylomonas sp.]